MTISVAIPVFPDCPMIELEMEPIDAIQYAVVCGVQPTPILGSGASEQDQTKESFGIIWPFFSLGLLSSYCGDMV